MLIVRSGATTVVGSLSLLLPLLTAGSPPPLTLAVLVTVGNAASATETVSAMFGALFPAVMAVVRVQVTVVAETPQVQPVPVADTKPSPVGKASVTVIVPVVVAAPPFDAVRV